MPFLIESCMCDDCRIFIIRNTAGNVVCASSDVKVIADFIYDTFTKQ